MAEVIHGAKSGEVDKIKTLLQLGKYYIKYRGDAATPLHFASKEGHSDIAKALVSEFKADLWARDELGRTPLHCACDRGHLNVVEVLVSEFRKVEECTLENIFDPRDADACTALMLAARGGHEDVVLALLCFYQHSVADRDRKGWGVLHHACAGGTVSIVRALIRDYSFDVNLCSYEKATPLEIAMNFQNFDVAFCLIFEFWCDPDVADRQGQTPLHHACEKGDTDLVLALVQGCKPDVNVCDKQGNTPLHIAAQNGLTEVVVALSESGCNSNVLNRSGQTPLHCACIKGDANTVQALIHEHKADASVKKMLHAIAVDHSNFDVAFCMIVEFGCDPNVADQQGQTPLHFACQRGDLVHVLALVQDHKACISVCDDQRNTPLHVAAKLGHTEVALALCDFGSDPNALNKDQQTPLHYACQLGDLNLVRALVRDYKANVDTFNSKNKKPMEVAVEDGKFEVAFCMICEFGCSPNVADQQGQTPLHCACKKADVDLVRALVRDHKADVNACNSRKQKPLEVALYHDNYAVVFCLICEFGCDPNVASLLGQTPLHYACKSGDADLVRVLVTDHQADVSLCDLESNTPLHVAALEGQHEVVLTLVQERDCDPSSQGYLGRTPLHMASLAGHHKTVQNLLKFTSPLVTDNYGNTPLHLASESGHLATIRCLLDGNAPVLIRNNNGQTPKDLASKESKALLQEYVKENRQSIQSEYEQLSKHAKRKYSGSHKITRMFVLGYPGAGKSSFIESLKREGLILSMRKVSESSVPRHTAGIIPSIHMSNQCGRIMFYDFAGDAEYYSSHAAIFESLASSRKGDNIFVIVVDLRKDDITLENTLHYWFTFIHYQKFSQASFLVVGSHLDQSAKKSEYLEEFCTSMQPNVPNIQHFLLDCRDPRSNQIAQVKKQIFKWVSESQKYEISSEARLLLGLLETDFNAVTACPVQTLVSHIKDTGVWLPVEPNLLYQILLELHEVGILLLLGDCTKDDDLVVLNVSKLTNEVHQLLFAEAAFVDLKKLRKGLDIASFNIGILPEKSLEKILPPYITTKCLVHLQYCQKISHNDVSAFSSLAQENSASQSFLFFPALCSVDKSQVSWDDSTGNSFSIGWLALCTDPHDYFPPRFLHVLLLRLVYGFTLSSAQSRTTHVFPEHSRRCTMWKNGVHWKMEEGVDCMVELVDGSKGVVVLTKSSMDGAEDCTRIFTKVVGVVMAAKAEFCHSTKPKFFLLDSSTEADYLNEDHQFAVSDVVRALKSPEGRRVIISVSGRGKMELAMLHWMLSLTLWNSLFPFQLNQVLLTLKVIVREIFDLGLCLGAPYEFLDSLRVNFSSDVDQRRTQLMRWWMKKSSKQPCWYTLVEALEDIERSTLAQEIRAKHGLHIQLQEKLLCEKTQALRPDEEFLHSLSGVVGSKWPSLAVSLALTEVEIKKLKGKVGLSHQELALQMLKIWVSREEATYGQLCLNLKTISLLYTPGQD